MPSSVHTKQGPNTTTRPSLNDGSADDALPVAAADAAVGWGQPHEFAILVDSGLEGPVGNPNPEAWFAGAINAVAAHGRIVLAGARNSGVWLINPEFDAAPITRNFPAQPLSYDWEHTDIAALEWGPDRPRFVFAGCVDHDRNGTLFLIELQTRLGGIDFVSSTPLARHADMGALAGLAFLPSLRVLLAATDAGLWWTRVPSDPRNAALYAWQRCVQGLEDEEFSCVASIADGNTIVVAGTTSAIVGLQTRVMHAAIYRGTWTGADFTFETSSIPAGVDVRLTRVSCCAANPNVAYAVTTDTSNTGIGAVLRTSDGGRAWNAVTIPGGHGGQGSYNECLAVHPREGDTLVLGWQSGIFVSNDAGKKWVQRPAPHSDQHCLVFAEQGSDEVGLYVGSDGGLAYSPDLGVTWDSRYNKHLRNLEIYSPNFSRTTGTDTAPFDVSAAVEGLLACATQDNGNVWGAVDDLALATALPWTAFRPIEAGDGETALLPDDASGLWCLAPLSKPDSVRGSAFRSSFPRLFEPGTQVIPVAGSSVGVPNPAAIAKPRVAGATRDGAPLVAIAGQRRVLYALWRQPGSVGEFTPIAELANTITSVATYDGAEILVGTKSGEIWLWSATSGKPVVQTVDSDNVGNPITRILWALPDVRFAINLAGRILKWNGSEWRLLAKGPHRAVYGIEFVPRFAGGVLFACTEYGVLSSADRGDTWARNASGLPRRTFGTNLVLASAGGRDYLYLSTYGWAVFRADVTPRRSVHIRVPRHDLIRRLVPIVQEHAGIEIRDGDILRVDGSPRAYELAVATLVSSLAEDVFSGAEAAETHLRNAAYALAQKIARREV